MKKLLICFFLVLFLKTTFAQIDTLRSHDHFVKHLSFKDTFWGNEEQYQVCYPKDHRTFFYSIILSSAAALILGTLIIFIKSNNNKKLKIKNNIIETQNKDLLDSINYAQRIQQAILPDAESEKNILKNGFVLYKPKNIVSGDFYWLHKQNDSVFIAVIDCTGHGVPGAFLTMLGYNAINKAVVEKELIDPSSILDSMNKDIKESLKQNQNQQMQDSMEVAVACFDTTTNKLMFSGANLSLHIVSGGTVSVLKGNKCTVGSVQQYVITPPQLQSVTLKEGDSFYIYSDGIVDQFGGKKGTKIKTKGIKDLLISIQQLSMSQQKIRINNFIANWQGETEQTDDITLIGYRV